MAEGGILITGASSGIGKATALRLARRGHTVFAGIRNPEDGERLVAEADGNLTPIRIDVADESEVKLAAAELEGVALSGLVNNAGFAVVGPVETLSLDDWRRQFETNLFGQIAVTKAFLPNLRLGGAGGRIVNVTSIGGRVVTPFFGPYVATKFGLEAVTDALRMELLPWGIDVIAVEPGSIKTQIWGKGESESEKAKATMSAQDLALYGGAIEAAGDAARRTGKRGISPDRAARTIEKALTTRRPKPRYLVGVDARLLVAMRAVLPTRLADRVYAKGMGLPTG